MTCDNKLQIAQVAKLVFELPLCIVGQIPFAHARQLHAGAISDCNSPRRVGGKASTIARSCRGSTRTQVNEKPVLFGLGKRLPDSPFAVACS